MDFDNRGEYNYYSTPCYSGSYDVVPFQDSSSTDYGTNAYDIVPFWDSSSSNYETNAYDIVPLWDSSSSSYGTNGYDIVPFQDSSIYSSYGYSEPTLFEYDRNAYSSACDPYVAQAEANYSAHNFCEPKLLEYNPIFHSTHYFSSDTQFVISYSNTPVLDDTDFDEYDPTPYGGGYDIAQTYGKPLPPSDEICYPRSVPGPDSASSAGSSYGSIPSPYGKTENEIKKVPISEPISEKEQPNHVNEPEKPLELSEGKESEGPNCDNGEMRGDNGHYGYGSYGKPIIEFPGTYGYGVEPIDLCESLFGYWPCLDRKIRREHGNCEQVASEDDKWKSATDYLFASPYTYSKDGVGNYGY